MNKVKIFLIEGNHLSRQGLSTALQTREEIEVIENAPSGKEGLKLVMNQKQSLDLIVMGLNLPKMDSVDLIRQIRNLQQQNQLQDLKVLVLTENTQPQTIINAFKAGADSYVLKNVDLEELVRAILITSKGNSYIDPNIASVVLESMKKSEIFSPQSDDSTQKKSSFRVENEEDNSLDLDPIYRDIMENNPLTERELEVLALIVGGCNNAQIAEKLFITVGTVKTHVRSILNKLCADDRTQAAVTALRTGLVE